VFAVASEEGVFEAPSLFRSRKLGLDCSAHLAAKQPGRNTTVDAIGASVPQSPRVPAVTSKGLVAAFAVRTTVTRSRLSRHKIEGYTGRPNDRFILVPNQTG